MITPKNPQKLITQLSKHGWRVDWRVLLLLTILPLSLLVFLSLSSSTTAFTSASFFTPLKPLFRNSTTRKSAPPPPTNQNASESAEKRRRKDTNEEELTYWSKVAVCLVGGARRFELTGPSIVERILKVYPNSDLFLHSPLDSNAFKFSLLKMAPRIAAVRIFEPELIPETESEVRVLDSIGSPNGVQGLLQYFKLVEGCLTLIKAHQDQYNFTYDWIIRTRVDGYWSAPLSPDSFFPGHYLVPSGSSFGGLNDRFGVGDLNTSTVALSRLSLIPHLDAGGFNQLNSETAFKAQLTTQSVPYVAKRLPFCVVSDRKYDFPPSRYGVPVAAMSSPGPLSGAKCRPCKPVCSGTCVENVMTGLDKGWSWTEWVNGTLQLCDPHSEWEKSWDKIFDRTAGKKLASARRRVWAMTFQQCVDDLQQMKRRTVNWDSPAPEDICRIGLESK